MGYLVPETLQDALGVLAGRPVKTVAGCTDYFPALGDRSEPLDVLDISGLEELRGIARTDTGWTIGAATTWTEVQNADMPPAFDGLKAAAREVGSVQIQNAGTIAGNLCNASPAADGVPPLLTLDAVVELRARDQRRLVKLADFITGVRRVDLRAHELVFAIHVPDIAEAMRSSFLKLGARTYLVISIAMVSVLVRLDAQGRIAEARIAVGSCSAVAQRLCDLEKALVGRSGVEVGADPDIWDKHLDPLSPIGDVRGTAAYRVQSAAILCRRAVLLALNSGRGVT